MQVQNVQAEKKPGTDYLKFLSFGVLKFEKQKTQKKNCFDVKFKSYWFRHSFFCVETVFSFLLTAQMFLLCYTGNYSGRLCFPPWQSTTNFHSSHLSGTSFVLNHEICILIWFDSHLFSFVTRGSRPAKLSRVSIWPLKKKTKPKKIWFNNAEQLQIWQLYWFKMIKFNILWKYEQEIKMILHKYQ